MFKVQYKDIPDYALTLEQEYQDQQENYPLFFGRMRRIQADIAFEMKEYDQALDYYAQGIAQIRQHGGYGMYFIDQELDRLEEKLHQLPPAIFAEWGKYLKEYWAQQEPAERYSVLISWCDKQIIRNRLRLE